MVYQWKPGARVRADAQTAGEVCETLAAQGRLSPKELLNVSRAENAPLHNAFTWDDGVAAEKWRTHEASVIICCLEEKVGDMQKPVRSFVTIQADDGCYQPVAKVLKTRDTRDVLLGLALKDALLFKNKYDSLLEAANAVNAMEEFIEANEEEIA